MATLKKLLVALGLDKSDYDKGLDDAKSKAKSSAADIGKSLRGIGDKISGTGEKLTKSFTLPIVAGMGLAVKSASDLNETLTKTEAVFGKASDEIVKFSKGATSIGQSQQSALDAAATFGIFGDAAGLAGSDLSGFAMELTTLSSDLASFYNTSPEEAITAIGAALRGESEPIRRYGVLLDDMTLKNAALKMGLISSTKDALTPQIRTLAAHNVIMEKTKLAQGDFARTSDGLANSSRTLTAEMSNFSGQIGNYLLPYALQLVQAGNRVLGWLTSLNPTTQKTILIVLGLVAGIGPLLLVIGKLVTVIGMVMPVITAVSGFLSGPILVPIGILVAAIAFLATAWSNNWGGIRGKIYTIWNATLKPIFDQLVNWLRVVIPIAVEKLTGFWNNTLLPVLKKVGEWILNNLVDILFKLAAWLGENIPKAVKVLADFWDKTLQPALKKVWEWMKTTLFPFLKTLGEFLGTVLGVAIKALAGFWQNVLLPALQKAWTFIKEKVLPILQSVATWIGEKLKPAFLGISTAIKWVTDKLREFIQKLKEIKLPDWLTPGSPTPFEIGLVGISRALSQISTTALPEFNASLNLVPVVSAVGNVATPDVRAARSVYVGVDYHPQVSFADENEVQQRFKPVVRQALREIQVGG